MIWPQCVLGTPWFQVSSRKCLVLRGIYPFPLPLPLDQDENLDSLLSRERAQLRRGLRQRIGIHPYCAPDIKIVIITHVVQNLYEFLSSIEPKRRYFEECLNSAS